MKIVICFISVLSFLTAATAQPNPDTLWTWTRGDSFPNYCYSARQTSDGGYILGGQWWRWDGWDGYMVKLNGQLNQQWVFNYDCYECGISIYSVIQCSDGGYFATGLYGYLDPDMGDVLVVKCNSQGFVQLRGWVYITYDLDWGNSVCETNDGGYAIAGICDHYGRGPFYCVAKIDTQGSLLWSWIDERFSNGATSIRQTADGGFITVGDGWRQNQQVWSHDIFLVKLNSQGDSLWTRCYGGTEFDAVFSIQVTHDGGYIMAGKTASFGAGAFDFYVMRTDSLGDTLWTRTYGESGNECAFEVQLTSDGGYIIAGDTDSHGAGQNDFYLVKISNNGDTLWTRTYGGSGSDQARSVQQTNDGGYFLAGSTNSFGAGSYDMYMVKTGPDPLLSAIEIQQPNGGEEWTLFSFDTVRWASNGSYTGPVTIELNRNYPLGTWETLAANIANDGEEVVWINSPASDHCRVRIWTLDNALFYTSDSNFAITTTDGILRAVDATAPDLPIDSWDAGVLYEGGTTGTILFLKNFGDENLTFLPPQLLEYAEFFMISDCDTVTLAPGEMSSCGIALAYASLVIGEHFDTLLIPTNAANGDGNNLLRIPLHGQLISAADDDLSLLPESFALHPAYPNPFNASTRIAYDLPQTSLVTLSIFNLQGQRIATLVDNFQSAGSYSVSFDGGNLASGVYLYRLQTASFIQTRKMVLLK